MKNNIKKTILRKNVNLKFNLQGKQYEVMVFNILPPSNTGIVTKLIIATFILKYAVKYISV